MDHKTIDIEKQSNISIMMIVGIVIMTVIFINSVHNTEIESIILFVLVCPIFTVLLGMYTFTYRGKTYIVSRVIFFIFLIVSLFCLAAIFYLGELGKGYSH